MSRIACQHTRHAEPWGYNLRRPHCISLVSRSEDTVGTCSPKQIKNITWCPPPPQICSRTVSSGNHDITDYFPRDNQYQHSPEQFHSMRCWLADPSERVSDKYLVIGRETLTHPQVVHYLNRLLKLHRDIHGYVMIETRTHGELLRQRRPVVFPP